MKKQRLRMLLALFVTLTLLLGTLPVSVLAENLLTPQTEAPAEENSANPEEQPAGEETGSAEEENPTAQPAAAAPATDVEAQSDAVVGNDDGVMAAEVDASTLKNHEVQGISPRGTTINLFDYWSTPNRNDNDYPIDLDNMTRGINSGHTFRFTTSSDAEKIDGTKISYFYPNNKRVNNYNVWIGEYNNGNGVGVYSDIVQNTLGDDGYPHFNPNTVVKEDTGTVGDDSSLSYLFDPKIEHEGKKSFSDVQGLLQINEKGYYYYNSLDNYAYYNEDGEDAGRFTLYDSPAVYKNNNPGELGQFFPFDSGMKVFDGEENGKLTPVKNEKTNNTKDFQLNHYFGMTMTTDFVQQYGGHVAEGQNQEPVKYKFNGDDDVWVFIDGVLVGDLGGIHGAISLEINFSTGQILVGGNDDGTLKDKFEAAGKYEANKFNGDTFIDDTYHELKFFYLERGNVDSNMYLEYNLVTIPESDLIKIDQLGDPVPGAEFKLFKANANYAITDENPVAVMTTDENGQAVLMDSNEKVLSLSDLKRQSTYFVLKETSVPSGYRTTKNMHLKLVGTSSTNLMLTADNYWESGNYASAKERIKAPRGTLQYYDSNGDAVEFDATNVHNGQAKMFAVAMQYTGKTTDDGLTADEVVAALNDPVNWQPVYGDVVDGWHLTGSYTMDNIIAAAKANPYEFEYNANSSDLYVDIDQLPGDIGKYYYIIGNSKTNPTAEDFARTRFAVAMFYTTADNWENVNADNTYRLVTTQKDSAESTYTREFSANLYVTNISNNLLVQKIDQGGNPVNGAEFTLYQSDNVTVNSDGTIDTSSATPFDNGNKGVITTRDLSKANKDPLNLAGGGFYEKLPKGVYYLVETEAPTNYVGNTKATKIIVDDNGVYADAGNAVDGVDVLRGVGSVVKSMYQFASGDIDTTLQNIKATLQSSTGADTSKWNPDDQPALDWAWKAVEPQQSMDLTYDASSALDYKRSDGADSSVFVVDSGWSNVKVTQGEKQVQTAGTPNKVWEDLGETDLTQLFSRPPIVRVTNTKINTLTLSKQVTGAYADMTRAFEFELAVKDNNSQPVTADGPFNYTLTTAGNSTPETGTLKMVDGKLVKSDDTGNIKLGHNQTIVIDNLTVGWKVTATEKFGEGVTDRDGYAVTWTQTENSQKSDDIGRDVDSEEIINSDGNAITFTNSKGTVPDTNLTTDNTAFWALITAAGLLALAILAISVHRYKRTHAR